MTTGTSEFRRKSKKPGSRKRSLGSTGKLRVRGRRFPAAGKEKPMGAWLHRISDIDHERKVGTCAHCGEGVPLRYREARDLWACRASDSRRSPAAIARNTRRNNLKRKFAMTVDRYEAMLLSQSGCCAICLGTNGGRRLAVDHCHASGEVRGLLCTRCNTGIGLFADKEYLLSAAIAYLQVTKKKSPLPARAKRAFQPTRPL